MLKGTVHPKKIILLSFTHPVITNLCDFLSYVEHEKCLMLMFSVQRSSVSDQEPDCFALYRKDQSECSAFCVSQKEESHTGLQRYEGEQTRRESSFFLWTVPLRVQPCSFYHLCFLFSLHSSLSYNPPPRRSVSLLSSILSSQSLAEEKEKCESLSGSRVRNRVCVCVEETVAMASQMTSSSLHRGNCMFYIWW